MDFREYLRVLRRRWILILACTAVVVAVAALITVNTTPQYSSSARVFVSTASSKTDTASNEAYAGGMAATQRVQSYAALVSDGELANRVVDKMGLDISPAQLSRSITANVVPETVVLQLSVTNPSAREARAICREVVDTLLDMISEIETPPGQTTPLLKGTVVGPATLPTGPVTPNTLRNLLFGLVIGVLFGIGAAIARELLDTTVKTGRQVEDALDAPVLGGIAFDSHASTTPLITSLASHAPRSEAFRVLRTNLQFVDVDNEKKIIVVTSSVPGEGKSTTAVNVAITMAQAGQRVLLVDGDLRRPAVADMLGLETAVGVTTVLLGRVELEEALQTHTPSGLTVLASGSVPPNPAELLQSHAMDELLERLRSSYDLVVIDSPPLLPVTDAALIARQADGAVLVVRYQKTTKDQLHAANDRLTGVGAHVLGAVFNRLRITRAGSYGGSTGYEYGYGYGPGPDAVAVAGTRRDEWTPDPDPDGPPDPTSSSRSPQGPPAEPDTAPSPTPVGGSRGGASVLSITKGRSSASRSTAGTDPSRPKEPSARTAAGGADDGVDDLLSDLLGDDSQDESFPGRHRG